MEINTQAGGENHSKGVIEYGFTSLTREEVAPCQLLAMVRSYWGIENWLHYRRDMTLREESSRKRDE